MCSGDNDHPLRVLMGFLLVFLGLLETHPPAAPQLKFQQRVFRWSHGAESHESHSPVAHGSDHGQDHQTHRDWDQAYLDGPWD